MKSWVITGGAACGKSTFSRVLSSLVGEAATLFSCDAEVSQLLTKREVLQRLVGVFGPAVLGADDLLRRAWLRNVVFSDAKKRLALEGVLHPLVLDALALAREAARGAGAEVFLAEVPLHYEIGSTVKADLTIVVAASQAVQIRRLMEIRGLDQDTALRMLGSQWTIEAKVERADVVIWNDGGQASLSDQALTLAKQIRQA